MDSMPAELDELARKTMQMEIEEAALKKETDRLSQDLSLIHILFLRTLLNQPLPFRYSSCSRLKGSG